MAVDKARRVNVHVDPVIDVYWPFDQWRRQRIGCLAFVLDVDYTTTRISASLTDHQTEGGKKVTYSFQALVRCVSDTSSGCALKAAHKIEARLRR